MRSSRSVFDANAVALLAIWSARADIPDEVQVYDDGLNKLGVFGLEIHTNYSFGGESALMRPALAYRRRCV